MIDAWEIVKYNIKNSGKTVLGHFPKPGESFENYIHKAVRKGASYFDMGSMWDDLILAGKDPWDRNKKFLDEIIYKEDDILLNVSKRNIRRGSYLEKEIDYLLKNGYQWKNQWSLKKSM